MTGVMHANHEHSQAEQSGQTSRVCGSMRGSWGGEMVRIEETAWGGRTQWTRLKISHSLKTIIV